MRFTDRIAKIIKQRQILKSMVVNNLRGKYIGSALGISWAVINPLLMMAAVSFVFTQIAKTKIPYYPLMALSALLPWFFFINSICESTNSMRGNADMLRQFVLPKEVIPISIVFTDFVIFLLGFLFVLPIFVLFNTAIVKCLTLLPLLMFLHLLFTLGVSMLFSIVNIYLRDLSQFLSIGIMFLFWMTPIFYPLEAVPENYRWIIMANPGTSYMILYRSLLYHASFGEIRMWLFAIGFALTSITGAYIFFASREADILKHI
ncbi:ABC transporter permease [Candidatus Omnitrophota bacterium]